MEDQKPPKDVIAQVGEELLTEKELEMYIPEAQRGSVTLQRKRYYVERWIENEILYQEAKRKKIDQDETVRWRTEQVARNTIIEEFLQRELGDGVKVSEEEASQYYQQNKDMFRRDEDEVRLSHILVKNIAEAGLITVRLREGESFDMVAKNLSLDERTRDKGGDIGYFPISNLPPQFYEVITKLKVGEVSSPIQTDYGFDIIQVTDKKEKGSIKEYELVKEEITNFLTQDKNKKEIENLLGELKKAAKVETFGWAADTILPETK